MDKISEILESRKKPETAPTEGDKFFSVVTVGHTPENFLEFRFKNGLCTCFSYSDLTWINYDPDGFIEMEFSGWRLAVKGRGLHPLFQGLKAKQAAWVKEADSEMQDNKANENFVEEIIVEPPKDFDYGDENKPENEAEEGRVKSE